MASATIALEHLATQQVENLCLVHLLKHGSHLGSLLTLQLFNKRIQVLIKQSAT
jgi:hypothetical protein